MSLSLEQVPAQKQELRLNAQLLQSLRILHLSQSKLEAFIEQQAQENPFLQIDKQGTLKEYSVTPLSNPKSHHGSLADPGTSDGTHLLEERSSFREKLLRQIPELSFSNSDERAILEILIDHLDPSDGYLRTPLQDLVDDYGIDIEDLEDTLILLQDEIEPAGVGARSLQECLELQARRFHTDAPLLLHMVQDHLELAQANDVDGLSKAMNLPQEVVQGLLARYKRLDASPGRDLAPQTLTISPDFQVTRDEDGELSIHFPRSESFKISVRDDIDDLIKDGHSRTSKGRAKDMRAKAQAMKSAYERRIETQRSVVAEIVRVQRRFFLDGYKGLRPLTQREVAEAIGMHESTISRVVSERYLITPQGNTHELKEFFSRAIPTNSGRPASSVTVKYMIQKMVNAEKPTGPLSDHKIASLLLEDHGIHIARRTVAKYRKMLKIPTSSQRRHKH